MYRGEFEVGHTKFTLDIEDTSGTFAMDFPGKSFPNENQSSDDTLHQQW